MREGEDGAKLAAIAEDRLLPGEELQVADPEDALHWVTVYEELFRFTTDLMANARARLSRLPEPVQQRVEAHDLPVLLEASERLERRLEFWQRRLEALRQDDTG